MGIAARKLFVVGPIQVELLIRALSLVPHWRVPLSRAH